MTAALVAEFLRRLSQDHDIQLTGDELRLLGALETQDTPVMISAAADAAGMNKPRASLAAAALLKRGLIKRQVPRHDTRLRLLELTKKGRTVCAKVAAKLSGAQNGELTQNETGSG